MTATIATAIEADVMESASRCNRRRRRITWALWFVAICFGFAAVVALLNPEQIADLFELSYVQRLDILLYSGYGFLAAIGFTFFFFPTIVACLRGHHNRLAIFVLNLLLGWLGLGWIVALVWSCTAVRS
jgi:T4 superinfection immunity protein